MDREPTNGQVAVAATLLALALGAFLAALFLPTSCLGQCGPGGCAPAFQPAPYHTPVYFPPAFAPEVRVVTPPSPPAGKTPCPQSCSALCTCGCNEGRECLCATITADGRRVVPAARKPAEAKPDAPKENFGLDLSQLSDRRRYILNGKEVDRDSALRVIEEGPGIPDESHLMRLVVIGPEADRKKVLDDLDRTPALARLKDRLLVQAYDASDPIIKRRGYVTEGSPSITLVAPGGQVLARNKDGQYKGAQALAAGIFAAGKPYLPANDPDLAPPKAANPLDLLKDVPGWAWGAGGVLLAMLLMRREPAK